MIDPTLFAVLRVLLATAIFAVIWAGRKLVFLLLSSVSHGPACAYNHTLTLQDNLQIAGLSFVGLFVALMTFLWALLSRTL